MTSSKPGPVFLDADVLAASLTRTLILVSSTTRGAPFQPRWSPAVEKEADRHRRPGQTPLAALRNTGYWEAEAMMVPDAPEAEINSLADTSPNDRHQLAAAGAAGINVVVTRNIRHFGSADLASFGATAIHPDLFLAAVMTPTMRRETLSAIAAVRHRPPDT
ncbi:MAG: hypothetical protein LBO20_01045, partial [Bifidobacteriaceae bacterium]|nr:hypothetical protein [Bifidobacteriaceae bacterium]